MTATEVKEFIKNECALYGVKAIFTPYKRVKIGKNSFCSGYFDDYNKILKVATKHKAWVGVALHEYCHLMQWAENVDVWKNMFNSKKEDKITLFDEWLSNNEKINMKTVKAWAKSIMLLEKDCEKRAYDLGRSLGFDLFNEDYIRSANVYVLSYNLQVKYRRWFNLSAGFYNNKSLIKHVPAHFNYDVTKPSPEFIKAFESLVL